MTSSSEHEILELVSDYERVTPEGKVEIYQQYPDVDPEILFDTIESYNNDIIAHYFDEDPDDFSILRTWDAFASAFPTMAYEDYQKFINSNREFMFLAYKDDIPLFLRTIPRIEARNITQILKTIVELRSARYDIIIHDIALSGGIVGGIYGNGGGIRVQENMSTYNLIQEIIVRGFNLQELNHQEEYVSVRWSITEDEYNTIKSQEDGDEYYQEEYVDMVEVFTKSEAESCDDRERFDSMDPNTEYILEVTYEGVRGLPSMGG